MSARTLAIAACVSIWPGLAAAELRFHPYVSAQETYESNVFSASDDLLRELRGDTEKSDRIFRGIAGVDGGYDLGLQRLYLQAEGRRFLFDNFSELDHNETLFAGRFHWTAADLVDGTLEASQERRMASFVNRNSTELTLETERQAAASFNVNIGPHWRVETGGRYYRLASPLPDFPDFTLRETSVNGGLKYKTGGPLSTGVLVQYLDGRFSGIPDVPGYHSVSVDGTVDYDFSELSHLSGQAGYTQLRGSDLQVDGFTGSLLFRRQVTEISELKLQAFRRIEGYLAGANINTDTGWSAGVTWHATVKLRVDADYTYIYSRYEALSPFATISSGRRDLFQIVQGSVAYQFFDWASLRLFGGYRDRDSNVRLERFNDFTAGAELKLEWPQDTDVTRPKEEERVPRRPT